jgi:hypothetical protein
MRRKGRQGEGLEAWLTKFFAELLLSNRHPECLQRRSEEKDCQVSGRKRGR